MEIRLKVPPLSWRKGLEPLIFDLLGSRVKGRIYSCLITEAATSREIVNRTHLYPSTVREALAEMFRERLVLREPLDSASRGRKPYVYKALPLGELIRHRLRYLERQLNRFARGKHAR